jgi:hypothetical protein
VEVVMDGNIPLRQRFEEGFLVAEDEDNPVEALANPVARATRRLRELKAKGVELSEILGGQAGATFVRDDCDGEPEVAYAAFALVYSPTAPKRGVEELGEGGAFPKVRASRKQCESRRS